MLSLAVRCRFSLVFVLKTAAAEGSRNNLKNCLGFLLHSTRAIRLLVIIIWGSQHCYWLLLTGFALFRYGCIPDSKVSLCFKFWRWVWLNSCKSGHLPVQQLDEESKDSSKVKTVCNSTGSRMNFPSQQDELWRLSTVTFFHYDSQSKPEAASLVLRWEVFQSTSPGK